MATGMTTQLKDLARSAPGAARGARPLATWREDLTGMLIAVWPITALYFDGRNHNNKTGQESFFSLAHIVLYTRHVGLRRLTRHDPRQVPDPGGRPPAARDRRPQGDPGRLRRGLHRPVHPRHRRALGPPLARGLRLRGQRRGDRQPAAPGAVLRRPAGVLDGDPLDVGQARPRAGLPRPTCRRCSRRSLFTAMLGFITMYTSAWMTNVAPTTAFVNDIKNNFRDVVDDQTHRPDPGPARLRRQPLPLPLLHGGQALGALVITTLALLGPTLLLLRRWRVPGARVHAHLPALRAAELRHDRVSRRVDPHPAGHRRRDGRPSPGAARSRPRRAVDAGRDPPHRPARRRDALDRPTSRSSRSTSGSAGRRRRGSGTIIIAIMAGFGVAFLVAPPSYGPRLVEGGED